VRSTSLPIWQIHGEILEALGSGNRFVLVAPDRSGKTTQFPRFAGRRARAWQVKKKIVVLQPRRVAARNGRGAIAGSVAAGFGAEVGYQIVLKTKPVLARASVTSPKASCSDGLQEDRFLADVGSLLTSFNERNC